MDDSERRTSKRSRFDQTEPEPRRSRFDRRSRSPPPTRKSDSARERSPLKGDADGVASELPKKPVDAAAAAGELSTLRSPPPQHVVDTARLRDCATA